MSDITLSSGIRQNLLSLQNTSAELTTTQEDLSTGKKVNTAFDNPTSFFTSQSLTNRANDLSALLDQIGQAQQTLDAANNGLTGLTSLLEQALSTAQQAQQASPDTAGVTTGSVSLSNVNAAGNLLITSGSNTYTVAVTQSEALTAIEAQINAVAGLGSGGAVTASDDGSGHLVLTGNSVATSFTVDANAESAALGVTTSAIANNTVNPTSSTRTTLQTNYNALLTQIDQLAGDASYNGVNLLAGNNLTVNFNENGTSSLTIAGVNFDSTGLGLSQAAAGAFQANSNLTTAEATVNAAITAVRAQTETFGTNSSTIQTRQTFEQNMINTLQTGASNLVLADQNQESADLLTEQTQQQLEISALSIANQANQSVLKLFG
jgi:flagellin-like hook-associated protein FlgL